MLTPTIPAIAIASALLLTACVPETLGAQLTPDTAAPGAMMFTAPPLGTNPVAAQAAIDFYGVVCLLTAPGFGNAAMVLANNDFAQSAETGTWFHPVLNLSFNVTDECSMVLGTTDPVALIPISLASASIVALRGDPDTNISVGITPAADIMVDEARDGARAAGPAGTVTTVERMQVLQGQTYYRAVLAQQ